MAQTDPRHTPTVDLLEPTAADRAALARADLQRRWQRGDWVRVEEYLRQHPHLAANPDGLLDLIHAEVLLREERGEAPQLDEYLHRFPHCAAGLRRRFALDPVLRRRRPAAPPHDQPTLPPADSAIQDVLPVDDTDIPE